MSQNSLVWTRGFAITVFGTAFFLAAQDKQRAETTRQMYYLAVSPKEDLPPISPDSSPAVSQPKATPAQHLGFRYTVMLAEDNKKPHAVGDRVLKAGDCVALELQANRSGYLYVLAKQSSGSWTPLMPSAQMPDEKNIIDPAKNILVPKGYCFAINDPPGVETVFVVLSRDPRAFYELYEGIKRKGVTPETASKRSSAALQNLNSTVEHMNQQFGSRDLSVRKIPEPLEKGEPRGSVYVVSSSDKPVTTIVAKIDIRHR